mgnify:CR=1 FL=1
MEDHFVVRDTLQEILEDAGYDVMVAEDGMDGVDKARIFKPDLVLSDIMMPRMNGFQAFKELRKEGLVDNKHILFLSAFADASEEYIELGLLKEDIMAKPFQIAELLSSIEKRLNQ